MKLQADVCKQIARSAMGGRLMGTMMTGFVASVLGVFTNLVNGVLKLTLLSAVFLLLFEVVPFYHGLTTIIIFIFAIMWFFIGSYARLGYYDYNLAILDGRRESKAMLLSSTCSWYDSIELRIFLMLLIALGSIFFLIPGIVIYYTYAMAPFLLEEKKDITVLEAMALSRQKMKGNRFRLFLLQFSFLGWNILGFLTLGLLFLYVHPYYAMAETVFFNEVSGRAEALYERT